MARYHEDTSGFLHRCMTGLRVVLISLVVEVALFWPTHWFFHEMGWLA